MNATDERDAIKATLDKIGDAFSKLDIGGWLSCFHLPRIIVFPSGAISPSTEQEGRQALGAIIDKLKTLGFTHTMLNEFSAKFLSETTALVGTVWTRYAQDKVLERIGSTYLFLKKDGQWLATMVTLHADDVQAI